MKTHINMIALILIASLLAAMPVSAYEAPSMWMEQAPDGTVELMVNTSENSSGANAWIHFDPGCVNITDMNFTGSPWQPMTPPGWSYQGDHVIMALTNFDDVAPGEYKIATMDVECIIDDCTSEITITHAEPIGVVTHNLTYTCGKQEPTDALISIGDGTGTVTIPIMITDATDVGAVDVTLSYDPTVVRVTGVSDGDMDCTYSNTEHLGEGWVRIGAVQGDNPGLTGQFTLLNIDFEAVSSGATCPLELTVTTFKDATPDGNPMSYSISNGVYISSKNGDVDGDGIVDIADAAYIAKHVIGIEGYESIDENAADVNGDGTIDMHDSMYLTKHVIGMAGFENLR